MVLLWSSHRPYSEPVCSSLILELESKLHDIALSGRNLVIARYRLLRLREFSPGRIERATYLDLPYTRATIYANRSSHIHHCIVRRRHNMA